MLLLGYINTLSVTNCSFTPSGLMPPPAPITTSGISRCAGMSCGGPRVSPWWTPAGKRTVSAMCLMYLTPARGKMPAVPGCGSTARNISRQFPPPCRSGLALPARMVLLSSWRRSLPRWRRSIGRTISGNCLTSLTAAFWKSMMTSTSERSSETPPPSALPTLLCPAAAWSRRTILSMKIF